MVALRCGQEKAEGKETPALQSPLISPPGQHAMDQTSLRVKKGEKMKIDVVELGLQIIAFAAKQFS